MKRRRLTERQVIDVLLAQGVFIICVCPACYKGWRASGAFKRITKGSDAIREHVHQLGVDGTDTPDNWQYWHVDCSHRKTHGTPATSPRRKP